MNIDRFLGIATKYLSKEASAEEAEILKTYLKEEKYNRLFIFLSERWNNTSKLKPLSKFNANTGIHKLAMQIREHENSFTWGEEKRDRFQFIFQPAFARMAVSLAAVILLMVGTLYFAGVFRHTPGQITWNEKYTMMGEKLVVTFLDGTRVTLNADSRLKYPEHFDEHSREIFLLGQAYFEVAHDTSKPFIVHAGNLSTIVLGTKFNIEAYPVENEIKVSLLEGKVKVLNNDANNNKGSVVLQPKQQLVYNKNEDVSIVENFDIQAEVGWKDNILKFDKTPLSKIFSVLERLYGVKFELADKSYGSRRITANFNSASLSTVLESVKKLTNMKYSTVKERDSIVKVIFFKEKQ